MILEIATHTIAPGSEKEFEAGMDAAKELIAQSHGFVSLKLLRGIEEPSTYISLVEWETVEDHMVGLRESEVFARLKELTGRYDVMPPVVEHFEAAVVSR
jgi:heme-degrading monooxygenase HmoA